MTTIKAKIREELGRKVKRLRQKDILPAVLYGPDEKETLSLGVDSKEFEQVYKETGESSLLALEIEGVKEKHLVLIQNVQRDVLGDQFIHADFYAPRLTEEIEAEISLVIEGEPPAVKDLEGTLVVHLREIEVKALPQDLPHEVKVDVSGLKTFEDHILAKDINAILGEKVRVLREPDEIIISIAPPEDVEAELEKPIEEKAPAGEESEAGDENQKAEGPTKEGSEEK